MLKLQIQEKVLEKNKKIFWILGCGKFGRTAIKKIKDKFPFISEILVVDSNLSTTIIDGIKVQHHDAVEWLHFKMNQNNRVDWIIPTVPTHIGAEFIYRKTPQNYLIEFKQVPNWAKNKFPNMFTIQEGRICISYANWICHSECSESSNICSMTGRFRKTPMFDFLKEFSSEELEVIVVKSIQLFAGLGGYSPRDLDYAFKMFIKSGMKNIMIATACKCHAIIDFVSLRELST